MNTCEADIEINGATIKKREQLMECSQCGKEYFLDEGEVSHHWSDDSLDNIDHDADEDHVAF